LEAICEVCGSELDGYKLDLGSHPLCDDLIAIGSSQAVPRYHQEIILCDNCLTAHQAHPVKKELLFKADYHYRANLTADVITGMAQLAKQVISENKFSDGIVILDVGCNDGSLLGVFKSQIKCTTIGVDPTSAILESKGAIDFSLNEFFNLSTAEKILNVFGPVDLITFTNVFAHIEDLPSLCKALKLLISEKTIVVIENHYLGSILENNQFDTFYHEHPRTYSAKSFKFIAKMLDMAIKNIEFPKRYGGNIRVTLSKNSDYLYSEVAEQIFISESAFGDKFVEVQDLFLNWRKRSLQAINELTKSEPIYGKSLPGRAVMLISALGISSSQMPKVFEQVSSPKVGFYVPGTEIGIDSDRKLFELMPARLIVWSWHIIDEICTYLEMSGYHGEIYVPLPEFTLYKII
jgi:hypothetical protein